MGSCANSTNNLSIKVEAFQKEVINRNMGLKKGVGALMKGGRD